MNSSKKVSFGLGARGLRDKDRFSKSDPYLVISRPSTSGGFDVIAHSETKKNTLNPDWSDFYFLEHQLNGNDKELNLKFEVYDDDGKKGPDAKDKLLGSGWFSLRQLEAAAMLQSPLALSDGKSGKSAGTLNVRSYKEHDDHQSRPPAGQQGYPSSGAGQGYHGPPSGQQGYPPVGGGQGYHGAPGYPPAGAGQGYHGAPGGQPGYPPTGAGQGYPPSSRPPSGQPAYPPQQGYNSGHGARGYPGGAPTVNMNDPNLFPASNLPEGPGGWTKPPQ